jgi:GNAT superfamily N-acetyltransferase
VRIDIRPITVPDRLDDPDAAELHAFAEHRRAVELDNWGHDGFAASALELLAGLQDRSFRDCTAIAAWDGDRLVGAVDFSWERADGATVAEGQLTVAPEARRKGVGTRLLEAAETAARAAGRPELIIWSEHGGLGLDAGDHADVLRAPDGSAGLPATVPAAAFATAHGYALMQLERVSGISVDTAIERARAALDSSAAAAAAAGYRVLTWEGPTPDDLVDAYASARARMALDAPAGGLTIDEEPWDAARVRAHEAQGVEARRRLLVAAVVSGDGEVAGYTEFELPEGREIAYQNDTLVVRAHRGHGLGMLVKLANLVRLADTAPERTDVYTWNADENRHMLAINLAMGFELRGLAANWQRP